MNTTLDEVICMSVALCFLNLLRMRIISCICLFPAHVLFLLYYPVPLKILNWGPNGGWHSSNTLPSKAGLTHEGAGFSSQGFTLYMVGALGCVRDLGRLVLGLDYGIRTLLGCLCVSLPISHQCTHTKSSLTRFSV